MIRHIPLLLFIGLAWGQENVLNEIAKCARIENDLDRLECYDNIANINNLISEQDISESIDGTGKWSILNKINPLNDTEIVTLTLIANSGENYLGKKVRLTIRCKNSDIELYINWNNYLGSDASTVTSRVGSKEAVKNRWTHSTDNQATFFPLPTKLIESMLGNEKFVAQVTPYNESPVTAVFDITGIDNAIKSIIEGCGEFDTQFWHNLYKDDAIVIEYRKRKTNLSKLIEIKVIDNDYISRGILYNRKISMEIEFIKDFRAVHKELIDIDIRMREGDAKINTNFDYDDLRVILKSIEKVRK